MSKRSCLILIAALAAPSASAHVSLETRQATAGASYKAVFAVPHGCAGSPTVKIRVQIPEGVIGTDDFVLQLMTGEATPLSAKEATLTLSLPERGIEPTEYDAELGSDGYWHVRKVELPFAGRWHVRIDALVTDFEKITLEEELEVAPR